MEKTDKIALIRTIYLYLVAFVSLMMITISVSDAVNVGIRTWIFPGSDRYFIDCPMEPIPLKTVNSEASQPVDPAIRCDNMRKNEELQQSFQRQRDLTRDISMLVVAIPLFALHWVLIQKERKQKTV